MIVNTNVEQRDSPTTEIYPKGRDSMEWQWVAQVSDGDICVILALSCITCGVWDGSLHLDTSVSPYKMGITMPASKTCGKDLNSLAQNNPLMSHKRHCLICFWKCLRFLCLPLYFNQKQSFFDAFCPWDLYLLGSPIIHKCSKSFECPFYVWLVPHCGKPTFLR